MLRRCKCGEKYAKVAEPSFGVIFAADYPCQHPVMTNTKTKTETKIFIFSADYPCQHTVMTNTQTKTETRT